MLNTEFCSIADIPQQTTKSRTPESDKRRASKWGSAIEAFLSSGEEAMKIVAEGISGRNASISLRNYLRRHKDIEVEIMQRGDALYVTRRRS